MILTGGNRHQHLEVVRSAIRLGGAKSEGGIVFAFSSEVEPGAVDDEVDMLRKIKGGAENEHRKYQEEHRIWGEISGGSQDQCLL